MSDALVLIRRYFDSLERFDAATLAEVLHPEVLQVEHPNALTPKGATRDFATMVAGVEAGRRVLHEQRYTIESAVVEGERLALEVKWTARLQVPVLGKAAGEELTAAFAVFVTLRDGRVFRQVNYDCFLP